MQDIFNKSFAFLGLEFLGGSDMIIDLSAEGTFNRGNRSMDLVWGHTANNIKVDIGFRL